MRNIVNQLEFIKPTDLVRAEVHIEAFGELVKNDSAVTDSYEKYGRIKPVYFIERVIGGEKVNAVIDGWKFVEFAISKNLDLIPACKLTIDNDEDVAKITIQLQNSTHNSYQAWYKMIEVLWPFYHQGKGTRNDLKNPQPIETTDSDKKLNIYDKIGRELLLSGTTVKHLIKVGRVNPLYFERLEKTRISLYAAYCECKKEEDGAMPEVPTVKQPVYVSSTTGVPMFSEPTTTDEVVAPVSETDTTENNETGKAAKTAPAEKDEFITMLGFCECCGEEREFKINKNQL